MSQEVHVQLYTQVAVGFFSLATDFSSLKL